MKRYFVLLMLILFVLSGCNPQANFSVRCKREAEQQNKRLCPREVDKGVMLDSIKFREDSLMFEYYYTMEDSLYPQEGIQKYKNDIRENLRKKIVNSIEMKRYKENGVAFNYIYLYRNTREKALEYLFTKADYK